MQKCKVCASSDFYKEAGYFFCKTCQTQNENIREEVLDVHIDMTTRLRKTRIQRIRTERDERLGWTTWELYNFVLIGLTNELIELGAPVEIKVTVLQLWARYLGKLEVAFTSTKKQLIPKLCRKYKKKDAEIIYGQMLLPKKAQKRRRTGNSTSASVTSISQSEGSCLREINRNKKLMVAAEYDRFVQTQTSSKSDTFSTVDGSICSTLSSVGSSRTNIRRYFNKSAIKEAKKVKSLAKKVPRHTRSKYMKTYATAKYRMGPELITPMKLLAILYLALRIHNQPIHLGDMLRYAREGHLSYYKLNHLIPSEVILTRKDITFLSRVWDISHNGMRRIISSMAKFIGIMTMVCPDLLSLIKRYCTELSLPRGISLYAERLLALSPPKMEFDKKSHIPNYEARAMAFIIVILKTLLALDGITEYAISNVAEKINSDIRNSDDLIMEKTKTCKKAAAAAYQNLLSGASSVKAVETALWWLECDEFFNCGYGSVSNEIGDVQMDAMIMDGSKLECGSVLAVSDIEHPISLARYVLDNFPNSIIVGEGARNLAAAAKLKLLSKGNMLAPKEYLTYKLIERGKLDNNQDIKNHQDTEALKNDQSAVGCIVYDGYTITVGTTGGGLKNRLVGSVDCSPLLGFNVYANRNVGCSLTGHGESIMKLDLSRVITDDIEQGCFPWEALKKNLDYALAKHNYIGGGIVFKKSGEWSVYFTSNEMPYAVIMNDHMIYGATLSDTKIEAWETYTECQERFPCNCKFPFVNNFILLHIVSNSEDINTSKLFSFREWQRYIECRRTILINMHFPTKIKYDLNIPDIKNLYIKFLELVHLKTGREEPEVKRLLPRELIEAMKRCIIDVDYINEPLNEINIFPPSLTPFHSYIQQLLEDKLSEFPSILRYDFSSTKIGYMTKLKTINELIRKNDIELELIDSNLHFIEKTVPFFETKWSTVQNLKDDVIVQDIEGEEIKCTDDNEDYNDYVYKKIPCEIKINMKKKQYYDSAKNVTEDSESTSSNEFIFSEIFPNGKLLISDRSDEIGSDNKNLKENEEVKSYISNFCNKYDINLTNIEKKAMNKFLNEHTNFIEQNISRSTQSLNKNLNHTRQNKTIAKEKDCETEAIPSRNSDALYFRNISNVGNLMETETNNGNDDDDDGGDDNCDNNILRLFRPFKHYWMYHGVISHIQPKTFGLIEKMFPRSFQWLLSECANITEMSIMDLYGEVCLVEAYYSIILKDSLPETSFTANVEKYTNHLHVKTVLKKW